MLEKTQEFHSDQRRYIKDASNHYSKLIIAERLAFTSAGWMAFRKKGDAEYLTYGRGNGQGQKSLGVRSPETEARLNEFNKSKKLANNKLKDIKSTLSQRSSQLKTLGLGRVPAAFGKVLRGLDIHSQLGSKIVVTGSLALAAYEVLSQTFFPNELFNFDRLDLHISAYGFDEPLLRCVMEVTKLYVQNPTNLAQLVAKNGQTINFTSSFNDFSTEVKQIITPDHNPKLEWLSSSNHVEVVAIDTGGIPVKLSVPDPRFFVINEVLWAMSGKSKSESNNSLHQSLVIGKLIMKKLPQYQFDTAFLNSLDNELLEIYKSVIFPFLSSI